MAPCDECGFDWTVGVDGLRIALAQFEPRFRTALGRVGAAPTTDGVEAIRVRPALGVWSAIEYAAHVGDVLDFYTERIERVLTEDRPALTAPAGGLATLVEAGDHRDREPAIVLAAIGSGATRVLGLLDGLEPAAWDRTAIGSSGGNRTLLDLVRRLAHDGHHHLDDLARPAEGRVDRR